MDPTSRDGFGGRAGGPRFGIRLAVVGDPSHRRPQIGSSPRRLQIGSSYRRLQIGSSHRRSAS